MRVQFWGVRGAVPTPGVEYLRYGGNTCCTAVWGAQGELVVLDAGTGFCQLGDALVDGPFGQGQGEMLLLLSHTHLDHILGFPFPAMIHCPGNLFTIYGPDSAQGSLATVCNGLLSPAYSPVYSLENIGARQIFHTINTQPFQVGGLTIRAWPFSHGDQMSIWAYRITEGARSLVYITDVRYASAQLRTDALALFADADLLIHSAPYMRDESIQDRSHCHIEDALDLAQAAGVRSLMLFHHAPFRTDDQMDALLEHYRTLLAQQQSPLYLDAAREGPVIDV
jgi:phosphoribosyl 1,2-cyclic phosphodiesterase